MLWNSCELWGWRCKRKSASFLEMVGNAEQQGFLKMVGHELQPDRQSLGVFAARDRDARQAGKVARDRENVGKVHRKRVVGLFPNLESDGRRGGCENHIHSLERLQEIVDELVLRFLKLGSWFRREPGLCILP